MKKTSVRKNFILDKLHRGFVFACIGITLYGVSSLGLRWYRYFTVLRPEAKQRDLMAKENLLAEGSSDILQDKAESLKM